MPLIKEIREKRDRNLFEFSKHAADRMILRRVTLSELREVIQTGDVIEDNPDDKFGPSCLVLGFTAENRAIHVQCSYPSRPLIKIITVYEPHPEEWVELRKRIR